MKKLRRRSLLPIHTEFGPLCCYYKKKIPNPDLGDDIVCTHCGLPKEDAIHSRRLRHAVESYTLMRGNRDNCVTLMKEILPILNPRTLIGRRLKSFLNYEEFMRTRGM